MTEVLQFPHNETSPTYRQQIKDSLQIASKSSKFIRYPKTFLGWLSFEQQAFYAWLIDYASFFIPEQGMEHNNGWFWVPFERFCQANGNLNKRTAERHWSRLLNELEEKCAIKTRLEPIRGHTGKKLGGKRIWIYINSLELPEALTDEHRTGCQ